jgi:hypothetical protein
VDDNDKLRSKVEAALLDPKVQGLRQVLGGVLRERMAAPDPRCSLAFLLSANVSHLLAEWERTCTEYLRAVVSADAAAAKATSDLHHVRNASPGVFNGALGDFFAEMSIVVELAKHGFSRFAPVPTSKGKTVDYECVGSGSDVCLECKNIRAPITIFDAFDRLMKEKRNEHPILQKVNLVIRVYSDNTVTDEQIAAIDDFLTSLATGAQPPPVLKLPGDVAVEITAREGHGAVMLFRSMGVGDTTPYVDREKLMAKVRDTVRKGVAQLAGCFRPVRVLGINIMSPDATIPSDWVDEIRHRVEAESGGTVQAEITFHYGYLART